MSAPTLNGRVNGSAYPVPLEQLVPKARKLAEELGSVPSRNRLMTELKIGRDKAKAVLAELTAAEEQRQSEDAAGAPEPSAHEPLVIFDGQNTPDWRPLTLVATAQDVPVHEEAPVEASPHVEAAVAPGPAPRSAAGRWHAWAGFLFAALASLAANVAHAQAGWGPRLTAAFAPLALVLAVEVMARVDWRPGRWWSAARWGGTGTVAVITFVVSYRAQADLFGRYGLDWLSAAILPLAVDGLMLVCIAALLSIGNRRTP